MLAESILPLKDAVTGATSKPRGRRRGCCHHLRYRRLGDHRRLSFVEWHLGMTGCLTCLVSPQVARTIGRISTLFTNKGHGYNLVYPSGRNCERYLDDRDCSRLQSLSSTRSPKRHPFAFSYYNTQYKHPDKAIKMHQELDENHCNHSHILVSADA